MLEPALPRSAGLTVIGGIVTCLVRCRVGAIMKGPPDPPPGLNHPRPRRRGHRPPRSRGLADAESHSPANADISIRSSGCFVAIRLPSPDRGAPDSVPRQRRSGGRDPAALGPGPSAMKRATLARRTPRSGAAQGWAENRRPGTADRTAGVLAPRASGASRPAHHILKPPAVLWYSQSHGALVAGHLRQRT